MAPSPLSRSRCEQCHDGLVMEYLIALTQDWTVRVGPWWYQLLRGYRWQAWRAGRAGQWCYAARSLRTSCSISECPTIAHANAGRPMSASRGGCR